MTTDDAVTVRGTSHPADDPPTVDTDGMPSKCLSLRIEADWGHFRRIDRTVTKQTYRIPPRTTIAGILAAIVGVGRDGYYDVFGPDVSAVSVGFDDPIRTVAMPSLGLGTNPGETFDSRGGTGNRTVKVQFPDSTANRQLHSYHYLVDPSYRIDVAIEDPVFYGTLRERLRTGTSYYPPSMGLSELLASVDWCGEHTPKQPESSDTVAVESVVPDGVESIVPTAGQPYAVERVPGFMQSDDGHRTTSGFVDYAFAEDGSALTVQGGALTPGVVDNRVVVFR